MLPPEEQEEWKGLKEIRGRSQEQKARWRELQKRRKYLKLCVRRKNLTDEQKEQEHIKRKRKETIEFKLREAQRKRVAREKYTEEQREEKRNRRNGQYYWARQQKKDELAKNNQERRRRKKNQPAPDDLPQQMPDLLPHQSSSRVHPGALLVSPEEVVSVMEPLQVTPPQFLIMLVTDRRSPWSSLDLGEG